jgi:purine-binding chemotaxis protein CheW
MRPGPKIDWKGVRARLEANRVAMERALEPGPERVAAVYQQRAARLAQPPEAMRDVSEHRPVLLFLVAGIRYGIELSDIAEVIPQPHCSPVPGGPPQLAGVIQVRGEIRPVWALSRLLELPEPDPNDMSYVLLLRSRTREFGVRAGAVEGIRSFTLAGEDSSMAAQDRDRQGAAAVKCVTADLVTILDPNKLLPEGA